MAEFPLNIVDTVATRINEVLSPAVPPLLRPLRPNDPNNSIGIIPVDWTPVPNSVLMGGGPPVPTLQTYNFRIHLLIKHTDEQLGRRAYAEASKKLRVMLYHDPTLQVALGELVEVESNRTERFMRSGIRNQRFLNNELSGQFIFLSATEYWAETQTDHTGGF